MTKKVVVDAGHGYQTAGKRTPNIPGIGVIREYEFNRAVAAELVKELKRHGFQTLTVHSDSRDVPLTERVSKANNWKADIYVSIHYNAGGGSGVETYHYPTSTNGKRLANCIHKHVKGGTPQRDRGVKTANFYVLRYTKMPAVLVEYGFMDDPGFVEAKRMRDPKFIKECAIETCRGICEYFGVPYKPEPSANPQPKPEPKPMYRVTIDGETVVDTAYPAIISQKVEEAIFSRKNEILIKIRD